MRIIFLSFLLVAFSFQSFGQYTGASPYCAEGGGLLVNEVSDGGNSPTPGDYVELLVLPDPANPAANVNLTGFIVDDNNGSAGNAPGYLTLGACFSNIPPGSLIIIYDHSNTKDPLIPADDPNDANGDKVYVLPTNSSCFVICISNPTSSNPNYCPCATTSAAPTFSVIGLNGATDMVQVRDKCGSLVHALGYGLAGATAADVTNSPVVSAGPQKLYNFSAANDLFIFSDGNWNNSNNFAGVPIAQKTPGLPNNPANAAFIASISGACTGGLVNSCNRTDAGVLTPPNNATTTTPTFTICQGSDLNAFGKDYPPPTVDPNATPIPGFTYQYAYILTTNTPPYAILNFNLSGDFNFATSPVGVYRIWGLSYFKCSTCADVLAFIGTFPNVSSLLAYTGCGSSFKITDKNAAGNTMTVTIVPPPVVSITPSAPTVCLGNCVNLLAAGSSNYMWSNGPTTAANNVCPTMSTTYTVTAGNGCTTTKSVTVAVNDMNISLTSNNPTCANPNSGTINVTIGSGTGPFTYNWTGPIAIGNTGAPTGLTAGTYNVTVTGAGPCTKTGTVTLVQPNSPSASAGVPFDICSGIQGTLGGSPTGSGGTGTLTYSWSPATNLNNSNASNPTITATSPTTVNLTYTVTVSDASGCSATSQVVVTVNPSPVVNAGPDITVCVPNTATLGGAPSASGGTPGYTYAWTPITNLSDPSIANPIVTPTAQSTTYTLLVTDSKSCFASDQVVVKANNVVFGTPNVVQPTCGLNNGSINMVFTASGTGVITFSWTGPTPIGSSTGASGLSPGTYVFTINIGTCPFSQTIVLTPSSTVTTTATASAGPYCPTNVVTLQGTTPAGSTGAWTGGTGTFTPNRNTGNATYTIPASEAGTTVNLTWTVTAAGGCTSSSSVSIVVGNSPTVSITNPNGCAGSNVTLTANAVPSSGTTYAWTNPSGTSAGSTQSITASTVGIYTVTACNNGCCNTNTTNLVLQAALTPTISLVCNNNVVNYTITMNGGTAPYSINGTNIAGTTSTGTLASNASYNFVIDDNGPCPSVTLSGTAPSCACNTTAGSIITTPQNICINQTANIVHDNMQSPGGCFGYVLLNVSNPSPGTTTIANVIAVNSSPNFNFVTTPGIQGTAIYLQPMTVGTTYYAFALYSPTCTSIPIPFPPFTALIPNFGNPCIAFSAPMPLAFFNLPTVAVVANQCNNGNRSLKVTFTGVGPFSFTYTTNGGNPQTVNNITTNPYTLNISPTSSTTYTITDVSDSRCSNQVNVSVGVAILTPTINTSTGPYCTTTTSVPLSGTPSGGTFSGSGVVANNFFPSLLPAGNVTVTYSVTDPLGCVVSTTATFVVEVCVCNNPATANAGADFSICVGQNINLNGIVSAGSNPSWTSSGTGIFTNTNTANTSYSPSASDIANGSVTITLTASDPDGPLPCTAVTDQIQIQISPVPTIAINGTFNICVGSFTTLTASGNGIDYNWSPSTGLNTTIGPVVVANPSSTTTYTVTSLSANGCTSTKNVTVTVTQPPNPTIATITSLCTNSNSVNLVGTPAGGVFTLGGVPITIFNPSTTGAGSFTITYTVTINGCSASTTAVVQVIACGCSNPATSNAGNDVTICEGVSVTLNGAITGAPSSLWTTSGSGTFNNPNILKPIYTPSAADIANGTVTLTLKANDPDGNGPCTDVSDALVLTISALPNFTINGLNQICRGEVINLTATGTGTTYTWSPSTGLNTNTGSSVNASPTNTTTYTVTASTAGCTSTEQFTLTVNPSPTATINPVQPICQNTTPVTLTGTPAGGTFYFNGNPITQFDPNTAGTFVVSYEVTNANNCTGTASISIIVNNCNCLMPATSNAGANQTKCKGEIVNLSGSVSSNSLPVWSTSGTGIFGSATTANTNYTPSIADINNGSVTLTLTATDPDGPGPCSSISSQLIVTISPLPIFTIAGVNNICQGNSTPLSISNTASASYIWTPTTGINVSTGTSVVANPTSTSTYTVTATNTALCTSTSTITITVNPLPIVSFTSIAPLCDNDPPVTLIGTPVGGVFKLNGTSITTFDPKGKSGNFTIVYEVSDANNCSNSSSITVVVNNCSCASPVSVNAGADTSICEGGNINLNGIVTNTPNLIWSTTGTGVIGNTTATSTTYIPSNQDIIAGKVTILLTGTDPDGNGPCVQAIDQKEIFINKKPTSTITGIDSICTGGSTNINVTTTANSIVWSPATNITVINPTTFTFSPSTTTKYYANLTDTKGCTHLDSVTIKVVSCGCANPVTANAGPDASICEGEKVTINVATSSSTSILWSSNGSGTFNATNTLNIIYTPSAADITNGNVTLTLTAADPDGAGPCTSTTDQVLIKINKGVIAKINALAAQICDSSSTKINLSANPTGGIFTLNSVNITQIDPKVLGAGNYTIFYNYQDPNGCKSKDSLQFSIVNCGCATPVSANAGPDISICDDETITINSATSNAVSILWSTNGTGTFNTTTNLKTIYKPSAADILTGNVTLTLTAADPDGAGPCSGFNDQVLVKINPKPNSSAGLDKDYCNGATGINITATGASTYTWSPATGLNTTIGSIVIAKPLVTTTYQVIAVSAFGCKDTDDVKITVFQPLVAPSVTCGVNSNNSVSFVWSGQTNSNTLNYESKINNGVFGAKTVVSTNPITINGLTQGDSVTIRVSAIGSNVCGDGPETTITCSTQKCAGASPTISNTNTSYCIENKDFQFSGNPTTGGIFSGKGITASGKFNPNIAGVGVHIITYSYDNGICILSTNLSITVNPKVNNSISTTICKGDSIQIKNVWIKSNTIVKDTLISSKGCDSILTINVLVEQPINITTNLTTCTASNVKDSFVYIKNIRGCDSIVNKISTKYLFPNITNILTVDSLYNGFQVSCFDSKDGIASVKNTQGGASPYTYKWSNNKTGKINTTLSAGWNYIEIIDNNNCSVKDSIFITSPPPIRLDLNLNNSPCNNDKKGSIVIDTVIGASNPISIRMNNDIKNVTKYPYRIDSLAAGKYTLNLIDKYGCKVDSSITLTSSFPLALNLGNDEKIKWGESILITPQINFVPKSIKWIPSTGLNCDTCLNVYAGPFTKTKYVLFMTDDNGCAVEDDIEISIEKFRNVYVPNVFSPNDDGHNDKFTIYTDDKVKSISLKIFDRWGENVFENANLEPNVEASGWDGTLRGQLMNPAVYVYTAYLYFIDGSVKLISGDITLIR